LIIIVAKRLVPRIVITTKAAIATVPRFIKVAGGTTIVSIPT